MTEQLDERVRRGQFPTLTSSSTSALAEILVGGVILRRNEAGRQVSLNGLLLLCTFESRPNSGLLCMYKIGVDRLVPQYSDKNLYKGFAFR